MLNPEKLSRLERRIATLLATGLGSGLVPIMPGTCGSAAAIAAWLLIFQLCTAYGLALPALQLSLLGCLGFSLIALWACPRTLPRTSRTSKKASDPGYIVIDEWAGQWLALAAADPSNPYSVALAFFLFRFFDMSKLGPVRTAERLPGAYGILADDLVAGLIAGLLLSGASWYF